MSPFEPILALSNPEGSAHGSAASLAGAWESLANLPGLPLAIALLAVVGGTVLWLAGSRIIRPVGAVAGGLLGATLASGIIAGFLSDRTQLPGIPVLALLLGGVLGALAGLLAYRLICAGLAGGCVATLVLLATLGVMSKPAAHVEVTSNDSKWQLAGLWDAASEAPRGERATPQSSLQRLEQDASIVRRVVPQAALERWDSITPGQRSGALLVASIAGILAGFAGLIAPKRSSAFTASILGSGIALAGLAWLTQHTTLAASESLTPWLIAWGLLALLGLAVQSGGSNKEPAPE
jgi:hypothetical protein